VVEGGDALVVDAFVGAYVDTGGMSRIVIVKVVAASRLAGEFVVVCGLVRICRALLFPMS